MKTIRKIFTSAVIALTAVSCLSVTASATTVGDVNGDGKIDVRDLMEASKNIVSTYDYDENFDVNDDGKSNILDLMIIAKSIVE